MTFDRSQPYNDLPLLPPAAELESKAVLKQAIASRTAMANLRGAAKLLPNQGVLIQAIGLQEAKLSSEIENIVTTNDDLFRGFANDGEGASPQTKEVLRYKDALWQGHQWVKQGMPLTTRLFETSPSWDQIGESREWANCLLPTGGRGGNQGQTGQLRAIHQRRFSP